MMVHFDLGGQTACKWLLGVQAGPGPKTSNTSKVTCPPCLVALDMWRDAGWSAPGEWGPTEPGSGPPVPFVPEVRRLSKQLQEELETHVELVTDRYWYTDPEFEPAFDFDSAIDDGLRISEEEIRALLRQGRLDSDPRYLFWIRREAVDYIEERLNEESYYSPAQKRVLRQGIRQMREDGLAGFSHLGR